MKKSVLEFVRRKFLYFFVSGALIMLGFIALTASSKKQVLFLNENIEITSSLSDMDLNGYSVFVQRGGIELENLINGEIIIAETVGAGTVTFRNCQNVNVTVQSKANILLDEKTSIQNLRIKDNARVSSIKSLEDKYRKKSFSFFKKRKIETQPEILNTEIESDLQPILEGGDFVSVKETERTSRKSGKTGSEGLLVTQDMSYEGNGVRLYIQNRPESATELNVIKIRNEVAEEIDWVSSWNKNSERFTSEYYTYEFLNAGEQYVIQFDYLDGDKKIESALVDVVPKYGQECVIDKKDISLFVDETTGDFYWTIPPKSNLPPEAFITYEIDSYEGNDWHFVGLVRTPVSENRKLNIYKDCISIIGENVLGGKVYMHVYYEYDGFRWDVMKTSRFKFDFSLLPQE